MLNKLTRRVCNQHLELSGGWSYSVQQASKEDLVIINIIFGSEEMRLWSNCQQIIHVFYDIPTSIFVSGKGNALGEDFAARGFCVQGSQLVRG